MGRLSRTIDLFFLIGHSIFFYMDFSLFFYCSQLVTLEICGKSMSYGIIVKIGCGLNILTLLKFWISSLYIIWIGFAAFVNALCQDVCKVSTPMTPFMFVICYSFIPFRDGTRVPIKGGLNY